MNVREIYLEDKRIGMIGQTDKGVISIVGKDIQSEILLNSLVGNIILDNAIIEGNISVSNREKILTIDPRWISYIEEILPFNVYASSIKTVDNSKFEKER